MRINDVRVNRSISFKNYLYRKLMASDFAENRTIGWAALYENQVIENGVPEYEFTFRSTSPVKERKEGHALLSDTDVFIATGMALHILKEDPDKVGAAVRHSYPNRDEFQVGTTVASDLNAFYNGNLRIMTGQYEVVPQMSTLHFRSVPETLKEAANLFTHNSSFDGVPGLRELDFATILNGKEENKFYWRTGEMVTKNYESGSGSAVIKNSIFLDGLIVKGAAHKHYEQLLEILSEF